MVSGHRRPGSGSRFLTALPLALVLGVTGATAVANTDAFVASGFKSALGNSVSTVTANAASKSGPVAGSEAYWLSSAGEATPAPREVSLANWTKPVTIGGTVTLGVAGDERVLDVIDISEIPASVTRVGTAREKASLVIVSLREVGKPDAPIVRFVVEAAADGKPVLPRAAASSL